MMFIIDFIQHIVCINEQQFSVEIYRNASDFDKYYLYIFTTTCIPKTTKICLILYLLFTILDIKWFDVTIYIYIYVHP